MRQLLHDLKTAQLFFVMLRRSREQHPDKNLFQRIEFACDAMKYHNVKAQTLYACKYGPEK